MKASDLLLNDDVNEQTIVQKISCIEVIRPNEGLVLIKDQLDKGDFTCFFKLGDKELLVGSIALNIKNVKLLTKVSPLKVQREWCQDIKISTIEDYVNKYNKIFREGESTV